MVSITEQIDALQNQREGLELQIHEINKQIEALEFQGVKNASRFMVTLRTQDDTEIKYARDRAYADKLVNNWFLEVVRHPGYTVDCFSDDTGFKYRYSAKDWMKIEREYAGSITIEANLEYVATE